MHGHCLACGYPLPPRKQWRWAFCEECMIALDRRRLMAYVTTLDGDVDIEGTTYRRIALAYPEDATLVPSASPAGTSRYVDSSDKLIAVTGDARANWWLNTTTHAAQRHIDLPASAEGQRIEVWNILLDALRNLDIARLSAKPGAVEAAGLRCRSLGAYAQQTTANAGFDTIKAAARDDLNVWALAINSSANNTSWIPALRAPGWFAYTRPDPLVIGGLPVPAATIPAGITAPTQAQLDSFDLRQALG